VIELREREVIGLPEDGMTSSQALRHATERLRKAGVEHAAGESERLLCLLLNIPRVSLLLDRNRHLDDESRVRFDALLDRRIGGEPLQHIEGTVEFREIVIRSDRRALIPRPETEQLVGLIARWAADRTHSGGLMRSGGPSRWPLSRILDIGTGSGAIALSLLSEGISARAVGIDISRDALALARENRRRIRLVDRLALLPCDPDPYRSLASGPVFDAIVSNPPYIESGEIERLATEVRVHDPRVALDGGPDGLAVIRRIIDGARERLVAGGGLFLEIGAGQGEAVAALVGRDGPWRVISVRRDLAGRDRFVMAER
jgi:release factor glutamine methyltransferase